MGKGLSKRQKIKYRIRKSISGTESKPRLSVFKSHKFIYAQLIDDKTGTTLASASSKGLSGSKLEQASQVGKSIGELAKKANIDNVVFDRNGYIYHGRVQSLADGAREVGLTL